METIYLIRPSFCLPGLKLTYHHTKLIRNMSCTRALHYYNDQYDVSHIEIEENFLSPESYTCPTQSIKSITDTKSSMN